jgi:hypothetical protein
MLGVTFFGVFLTPVFFYLFRRHGDRAEVPHPQGLTNSNMDSNLPGQVRFPSG